MNRWISNVMGLSAVGALIALGWAGFEAGSAIRENRPALKAASAGAQAALSPTGAGVPTIFNEARDITIAMLKPCKPGKPETCGLIPSVRNVAVDAGVAVQNSSKLVDIASQSVSGVSQHVQGTSDAATRLLDSTAATINKVPDTLTALNGAIGNVKDLAGTGNDSLNDINRILERQAINRILDNTASMMESGAGILADGRKVTDKATADYLSPKPWYRKVGRYASDAFDYGALFARHTP